MRLSDAITLGSTVVKPKPGDWRTCAFGAATKAMGIPAGDIDQIEDEWPWLEANCHEPLTEIIRLFDQRVCRGEMTLDQLIAHVRQIEPPCECGQFDCCCARVEDLLASHDVTEGDLECSHDLHAVEG
jgi:hypothetical protein